MRTPIVLLTAALAGSVHAQTPTVVFGLHTDYDLAESEPHQGFAADLDHDGNLDLVITTTGGAAADGKIGVLYGDGTGDFSQNQELGAGHAPWAIGSGDFDGDGWIDLVAAESGQPFNGVFVWRNNHNGGFTAKPTVHTLGTFPIGIATGDFDQDGHVDLAVACNQGGYGLTTFHGNGDGTFAPGQAVTQLNGFYGTRLVSADFNGDGRPDLAEAHYSGVRILLAGAGGAFSLGGDVGNELIESVSAADLDGDGVLDLATVGIYSSLLRTWHGIGNGSFSLAATLATGDFPRDAVPFDLNGDGTVDLIVPSQSNHVVQMFLGTGGGGFLPAQSVGAPFEPMEVIAGDWNGDGFADLAAACRNFGQTAPAAVWLQTPPAVAPFCSGDGTGTACPCGNAGQAGHGCANSVNPSGAMLSGTGVASIAADSFLLIGSGMPNAVALYFQGTTQVASGAGASFGDGLRCAGGTILRLGVESNAAGGSQYPAGGDAGISAQGANAAGNVRTYQAWYRNAAAFCNQETYNLTNGVRATWSP
jgi:hypothetical protein